MRIVRLFTIVLLLGETTAAESRAGHFFHREKQATPGRPRYFEHTFKRAGNPLCVSPHAQPTRTPAYVGYYVGGGAACCAGEPRRSEEGTWGKDYAGLCFPRLVKLQWSHGRRYQGGGGTYATEGFAPNARRGEESGEAPE